MVGRESAAATMASIEALIPAMVGEKVWVPFLSPPKQEAAPRTRSTLPMIEPMIEAFTTVVRPAERAKMVMMSSAALPKVALRMPPILGPAWWPRHSVAWPEYPGEPDEGERGDGEDQQYVRVQKLRDQDRHRERRRGPVDAAPYHAAPLRAR